MADAEQFQPEYVYTTYITTRNGKRIYAAWYGLKAFRLKVRPGKRR